MFTARGIILRRYQNLKDTLVTKTRSANGSKQAKTYIPIILEESKDLNPYTANTAQKWQDLIEKIFDTKFIENSHLANFASFIASLASLYNYLNELSPSGGAAAGAAAMPTPYLAHPIDLNDFNAKLAAILKTCTKDHDLDFIAMRRICDALIVAYAASEQLEIESQSNLNETHQQIMMLLNCFPQTNNSFLASKLLEAMCLRYAAHPNTDEFTLLQRPHSLEFVSGETAISLALALSTYDPSAELSITDFLTKLISPKELPKELIQFESVYPTPPSRTPWDLKELATETTPLEALAKLTTTPEEVTPQDYRQLSKLITAENLEAFCSAMEDDGRQAFISACLLQRHGYLEKLNQGNLYQPSALDKTNRRLYTSTTEPIYHVQLYLLIVNFLNRCEEIQDPKLKAILQIAKTKHRGDKLSRIQALANLIAGSLLFPEDTPIKEGGDNHDRSMYQHYQILLSLKKFQEFETLTLEQKRDYLACLYANPNIIKHFHALICALAGPDDLPSSETLIEDRTLGLYETPNAKGSSLIFTETRVSDQILIEKRNSPDLDYLGPTPSKIAEVILANLIPPLGIYTSPLQSMAPIAHHMLTTLAPWLQELNLDERQQAILYAAIIGRLKSNEGELLAMHTTAANDLVRDLSSNPRHWLDLGWKTYSALVGTGTLGAAAYGAYTLVTEPDTDPMWKYIAFVAFYILSGLASGTLASTILLSMMQRIIFAENAAHRDKRPSPSRTPLLTANTCLWILTSAVGAAYGYYYQAHEKASGSERDTLSDIVLPLMVLLIMLGTASLATSIITGIIGKKAAWWCEKKPSPPKDPRNFYLELGLQPPAGPNAWLLEGYNKDNLPAP